MRWFSIAALVMLFGVVLAQHAGCGECEPGEYKVIVEEWIPPSPYVHEFDPDCKDDAPSRAAMMVREQLGLSDYIGGITDPYVDEIAQKASEVTGGGFLGQIIAERFGLNYAVCVVVMARLPQDAVITRDVIYRVRDQDFDWQKCAAYDDECGVGWSRFEGEPVVEQTQQATHVWTVFRNWTELSGGRYVRMQVYYR